MGNSLELAHLQGLQAFFLGTYLGYFVCGPPNLRGGCNFHSDKIKFSRNVSSLFNYGKSVAFGEGGGYSEKFGREQILGSVSAA